MNISFEEHDRKRLKKLKDFLEKNEKVKFIGTYRQLFEDDYPVNYELVNLLRFDRLTIKQFKARHIKLLIKKWFPSDDKYEAPKKLEVLTNAFLALNLPRTPLAVSLFLWIIEKQENFKPINNSTMVENFVEKLLNKHGKQEVLRDRFNYDNKVWLLSEIAFKMLHADKENYALSYTEFDQLVDDYLRKKKFDFSTEVVLKDILQYGIFIRENGNIRFRFTCFFEFFLVKRMQTDQDFKSNVLLEDNFLKYANEIDYYTGLNRGESEILKLIVERLDKAYDELNKIIPSRGKSIDELFSSKDSKGKEKPSLVSQLDEKNIIRFLPQNKPTEKDLEGMEDQKLELQKEEKGISKKQSENKFADLAKLLVLALKVIKNSEEVDEENLKFKCYTQALKNSISYAILHKAIFELFLQNKDKFPSEKIEEFSFLNRFLPLVHQLMMSENIGTQKLSAVIREKINADKKNNEDLSEFEQFLSVFLYADIRGNGYDIVISDFIKGIHKSYIEDIVFFKLVTYFYNRSKDEEMDKFYLNLIAELLIKSKNLKRDKKGEIIERYRKKKADQLKLFEQ